MPVPRSGNDVLGRQLLRDVVFDRLRTEILNGQFEPGERLSDDTLTDWLGVSRTPIREALNRLTADGLVEMEVNRYTRVPFRSAEAYARAAEYMHMIRGFVLEHIDRVPDTDLRPIRKTMAALLPKLREHDRAAQVEFNEQFGRLAELVDNPLVTTAEERVRSQAQFHLRHDDSVIRWENIIGHAEQLVG